MFVVRRSTLKFSDKAFNSILKSKRIMETLVDYDISKEDLEKYGKKALNMARVRLGKLPKLNSKSRELCDFYDNVITYDYFDINEFDNLKTVDQAIDFFKRKTGKSYSVREVVDFYKFQIYEISKDLISECEKSINRIIRDDNGAKVSNKKLSDSDLDSLSGGKGGRFWGKRVLGAAFSGLSLMSPVPQSVIAMNSMSNMHGMPSEKQLKKIFSEVNVINQMPRDFYPNPEKILQQSQKKAAEKDKNFFDRLPGRWKTGVALATSMFVPSIVSSIPFIGGPIGQFLEIPSKISDWKAWPGKLQDNVKEAEKSFSELIHSNNKAMQSLSQSKNREGNFLTNILTSQLFGQEEALTDYVTLILNPFMQHLSLSFRKQMKQNNFQLSPDMQNFGTDKSGNKVIKIATMFGPAGTGKTETYKVTLNEIFGAKLNPSGPSPIPSALIQVSRYSKSRDKSFTDWLWANDTWQSMLNGARSQKQTLILFDEFDKLDTESRKEIQEFLRGVYDNAEFPATGSTSAISLDRAIILIASNEVNPLKSGIDPATGAPVDLERPDEYKNLKYWDPSFISRVSAFIDYRKLTLCSLSEILSGALRETRKDYCWISGIHICPSRDFCYWAVSSISAKDQLNNGARLVQNNMMSLIKAAIDKQLPLIKQSIGNAMTAIKKENLKVELKWVSKAQYRERLGTFPPKTITIPGQGEFAPMLVIRESIPKKQELDWKNMDSICDVIDEWEAWAVMTCTKLGLITTGVNSLHDRLIYNVIDAFRHKRDPKVSIKAIVDRWVDKISNGKQNYIMYNEILKQLKLPSAPNPLDRELKIITDNDNLDGPSLDILDATETDTSTSQDSEESLADEQESSNDSASSEAPAENIDPANAQSSKTDTSTLQDSTEPSSEEHKNSPDFVPSKAPAEDVDPASAQSNQTDTSTLQDSTEPSSEEHTNSPDYVPPKAPTKNVGPKNAQSGSQFVKSDSLPSGTEEQVGEQENVTNQAQPRPDIVPVYNSLTEAIGKPDLPTTVGSEKQSELNKENSKPKPGDKNYRHLVRWNRNSSFQDNVATMKRNSDLSRSNKNKSSTKKNLESPDQGNEVDVKS